MELLSFVALNIWFQLLKTKSLSWELPGITPISLTIYISFHRDRRSSPSSFPFPNLNLSHPVYLSLSLIKYDNIVGIYRIIPTWKSPFPFKLKARLRISLPYIWSTAKFGVKMPTTTISQFVGWKQWPPSFHSVRISYPISLSSRIPLNLIETYQLISSLIYFFFFLL